MARYSIVFPMIALFVAAATRQLPTVPEILSTQGDTRRVNMTPSGEMPQLDTLLRRADLVISATVRDATPFLSDDHRDVYTSYSLAAVRILYRPPVTRPTVLPDIRVDIRGGTISIGGKTFVQEEHAYPPLAPGTKGVFLLVRKGDRYRLAGGGIGAFIAQGERLRPYARVKGFGSELAELSISAAEAHVSDRARILRP